MNNERMRSRRADERRYGRASARVLKPTVAILLLGILFAVRWSRGGPSEEVAVAPPAVPAPIEVPPAASTPSVDSTAPPNTSTDVDRALPPLPAPPAQGGVDISARPVFIPRTLEPSVRNVSEVLEVLQREYPPLLRTAGVEGTVVVDVFIDRDGQVVRALLAQTSGYSQFDEVALRTAALVSFTPAMNQDDRVPAWVRFPIGFAIQR